MGVYIMVPSESRACRECPHLIVGGFLIENRFFLVCYEDRCEHIVEERPTEYFTREGERLIARKVREL